MKYIKTYEELTNNDLNVGGYVSLNLFSSDTRLNKFVNNNFGKIISIHSNKYLIEVEYKRIPITIKSEFKMKSKSTGSKLFSTIRIIEYFKDIDDLKLKLTAKKYNL